MNSIRSDPEAERDPSGDLHGALTPVREKHHAYIACPKGVACPNSKRVTESADWVIRRRYATIPLHRSASMSITRP